MSNPHEDPAALKALQDSIYRERILRARRMTPEERLAEAFEQSDFQMSMMLAGAMSRLGTDDEVLGWREVSRWLKRLDAVHERGLHATSKPDAA